MDMSSITNAIGPIVEGLTQQADDGAGSPQPQPGEDPEAAKKKEAAKNVFGQGSATSDLRQTAAETNKEIVGGQAEQIGEQNADLRAQGQDITASIRGDRRPSRTDATTKAHEEDKAGMA